MIEFPPATKFGQRISLAQLKTRGLPVRILKAVKSLVWAHKLSPATLQLPSTESVKEIEVMDLTMRDAFRSLRYIAMTTAAIDSLIPSPLVFRVFDEDGSFLRLALNLKTSGGKLHGDSDMYRLFSTDRKDVPLPSGAINLESFLLTLAASIAGMTVRPGEPLRALDERHYRLAAVEAAIADVEKKMAKEKRLDAKYSLAQDRLKLEKGIEVLR